MIEELLKIVSSCSFWLGIIISVVFVILLCYIFRKKGEYLRKKIEGLTPRAFKKKKVEDVNLEKIRKAEFYFCMISSILLCLCIQMLSYLFVKDHDSIDIITGVINFATLCFFVGLGTTFFNKMFNKEKKIAIDTSKLLFFPFAFCAVFFIFFSVEYESPFSGKVGYIVDVILGLLVSMESFGKFGLSYFNKAFKNIIYSFRLVLLSLLLAIPSELIALTTIKKYANEEYKAPDSVGEFLIGFILIMLIFCIIRLCIYRAEDKKDFFQKNT